MFLQKLFNRLLYWRLQYIGNRTFLIIASILVGAVAALAAIVLKRLVHLLHKIPAYFDNFSANHYWLFTMPLLGIVITILVVKFLFRNHLEKGLGSILYSIIRKSSKVDKNKMYSHIVTSGITVGLGGSAGLEAPIAITGSAIGANIADLLNFGYRERTLLLACGAASGIAAVFNCPIAGVIFALEVLLTNFSIPSFIPLLISTATATIISKLLYKGQLFYLISNDWYFHAIPFYILLGLICGLLSAYMKRITLSIEGYFVSVKKKIIRSVLGMLFLGLLIYLIPPLFGEGYDSIESLLKGSYNDILNNSLFGGFADNVWFILTFTIAIILIKVIATSLTVGSGGNGGIFAPSLFTGAFTGFGLAYFVNATGISSLNVPNFIVVGMAGILSGVVHAPLTAIFLIAEITGGYVLFVPLMIVSALSFFITRYFEPYSVYTKHLAQRGHISDDKDSNLLNQLNIKDLIEKDFIILKSDDYLKNFIKAFTKSNRNMFPVTNKEGEFAGVILLDNIKDMLFQTELYDKIKLGELVQDVITIDISEDMTSAMSKFEKYNLWSIPVLKDKKYVGFISRSNILTFYRQKLRRSTAMF
ncbi:MAG: chloride channel protein [Bacteroidota bacterium]|nr:chloride channel protein [Bacteroidota bacterium]